MSTTFSDNRDEIFKKPEFMSPAEVAEIKSVIDSAGNPWCIFSTSESWAIRPGAAKIHTDKPTLDVSIRLKWADDESFIAPNEEIPIVGVFRVPELAAFNTRHPRLALFAFPLSAIPDTIHVT